MQYKFPIIKNIKDVEFAIHDDYTIVKDAGDHIILNYTHVIDDVFPCCKQEPILGPIRREFRGITFDKKTGNIIRRPYQKFFNVNEKSDTKLDQIDISKPHLIYEKLDGSMICPYRVEDRIIWGTKMGDTDVGKQVEMWVKDKPNYLNFVNMMLKNNLTPIFEWCSRKQRIVLDYSEDILFLVALRDMFDGNYAIYQHMLVSANTFDVPTCETFPGFKLSQSMIDKTKDEENVEGYVVRFKTGHMVKIKTAWYCQLHRVKSEIEYERGVVNLIINDNIDDLKPLMLEEDLKLLEEYEEEFIKAFWKTVHDICNTFAVIEGERMSRKDFALNIAPKLQSYEKQIIFNLWGDCSPIHDKVVELLKEIILTNCTKNVKFDIFRKTALFDNVPKWRERYIEE